MPATSRPRLQSDQLYAARVARFRSLLREKKADGYLVTSRPDQCWLTGFTGEDGAVLVTPERVILLTDGRFAETARQEAPWAKAVVRKKRSPDTLAAAALKAGVRRLAFDPGKLTVTEHMALKEHAPKIKLVPAANLIAGLRHQKSAEELALIRRAIAVAQDAFTAVRPEMKAGVTESHIAARLVFEMQSRGASGPAFPPIVASGPHSALPHYAARDVPIRDNDILLIDWGARVDWYVSDLTRVIGIGTVPPRLREVQQVVRAAHDEAIAAARPGLTAGRLDRVAREHIRKAGFGPAFSHSLGHGIGLEVHEGPALRKANDVVLQPGMVVTIEPGIYLPGIGGVRIEDDICITPDGCEMLSSLPVEDL